MIFTRLRARNFGVYNPEIDVKFQQKGKKNLWVFEGLTGAGKTTLFLAFIWGLYGDDGLEFHTKMRAGGPRNAADLISNTALGAGDSHMSVDIFFTDNRKRYILQRALKPKKSVIQYPSDYEEIVRLKDEVGKDVDLPNERIKEMLPLEASQFFFFAGEVLQKYAEPTSAETKDAIEKVLGFPEIRSAINDTRYYGREITAFIKNSEASSEDLKAETRKLELLQDSIERRTKEIEAKKKRIEELSVAIPQLQAELKGFEEIRELQLKAEEYESRKKFLEEEEVKLANQRYERIRNLPFLLARKHLRGNFAKVKQQIDFDSAEAGIRRTEPVVQTLEGLIKADICWCGTPIAKEERDHLHKVLMVYKNQLNEYSEKAKNKTIPSIEEISEALGFLSGLDADYERIDTELKKIRVEIGDLITKIEKTNKKIKGAPTQKIRITKELLDKSTEEKITLAAKMGEIQGELERDNRAKEETKREIAKIQIQSKAVDAWRNKLQVATQAGDALDFVLTRLIKEKKKVIEAGSTETLKAIAARETRWKAVTISDDYTVELHENTGGVIQREDLSDGQKEILALAFIKGLQRATDRSAPVVIDYLLGRLDLEYQDNVAEELSMLGEQVVYLVLDSELTPERRRTLERQANAWYMIKKDPKTGASDIREAGD